MAAMHLNNENFKTEVLEAKGKVLVDFFATWCGPCRMLGPVIDSLAQEITDIKVFKVDIDEAPELAGEYKVEVVPTLIVFENGKVVKSVSGVIPKPVILDLLK